MRNAAVAFAFAFAFASVSAAAQPATPAGVWKTMDDDGKTEKSVVRIVEEGGVYAGKVEKIVDPGAQDARCVKCEGARANQPILGMTILEGVRPAADDPGLFDGGLILDPHNGKTYKVRLRPVQGGSRLEVRGYIGLPLLGRTQTWIRVE